MKQILIILVLFIGINTFGQDVNKEIEEDFNEYHKLISERNIEKALEYTNPKFFELIPREQMKNLLESVYKMPNIEYKTGIPSYVRFEDVKKFENVNYVKFFIKSPIEMKFKEEELNDEKISLMTKSFEAKFGVGNVNYNKNTGFFSINADKIIIASSDDNLKDWKFVTVDNPKMKTLLEKILPLELLD
jgi:hypothetical protein